MEKGVVKLRFALIALCAAMVACGGSDSSATGQPSLTGVPTGSVSQEQAEQLRDGCVADSLLLLRDLADRIAPLARVRDLEHLEATATGLDCSMRTQPGGFELLCEPLGLVFTLEFQRDGVLSLDPAGSDALRMMVRDLDAERGVEGEISVRPDPARGLVMQGGLHRRSENGCEAILDFDELIGHEFGGAFGVQFAQGAVDVTVLSPDAVQLAHGSAAWTGRDAFLVLNFDELAPLIDSLSFDR